MITESFLLLRQQGCCVSVGFIGISCIHPVYFHHHSVLAEGNGAMGCVQSKKQPMCTPSISSGDQDSRPGKGELAGVFLRLATWFLKAIPTSGYNFRKPTYSRPTARDKMAIDEELPVGCASEITLHSRCLGCRLG